MQITVHGTEDVPVITSSAQTGAVTEDADNAANENNETHHQSGTITFTDVDLSDIETSSITNTVVTPTLANGYTLTQGEHDALVNAFTIDAATHSSSSGAGTIGWNYDIADSALDFLGANDQVVLTYTVQTNDGNGGTATRTVPITVHGTEDVPVITSSAQTGAVTEDTGQRGEREQRDAPPVRHDHVHGRRPVGHRDELDHQHGGHANAGQRLHADARRA